LIRDLSLPPFLLFGLSVCSKITLESVCIYTQEEVGNEA
jgi:hypothetical protein